MTRIRASNIQFGNSFVVGQSNTTESQQFLQNQEPEKDPLLTQQQADEIIADAEEKASQLLYNANSEASKIIDEANARAAEIIESLQQQGYQDGYNHGYTVGFTEINNALLSKIHSVQKIADESFSIREQILASSEPEMLELTVSIAEKIIRRKLDIQPEIVLNIIKAAIIQLKEKDEVRILVHPSLSESLYDISDELTQTIKGLKNIKIVDDRSIPADGAIIESPDSRIDARLQTQIEEITKALLEEAHNSPAIVDLPPEINVVIKEPAEDVEE